MLLVFETLAVDGQVTGCATVHARDAGKDQVFGDAIDDDLVVAQVVAWIHALKQGQIAHCIAQTCRRVHFGRIKLGQAAGQEVALHGQLVLFLAGLVQVAGSQGDVAGERFDFRLLSINDRGLLQHPQPQRFVVRLKGVGVVVVVAVSGFQLVTLGGGIRLDEVEVLDGHGQVAAGPVLVLGQGVELVLPIGLCGCQHGHPVRRRGVVGQASQSFVFSRQGLARLGQLDGAEALLMGPPFAVVVFPEHQQCGAQQDQAGEGEHNVEPMRAVVTLVSLTFIAFCCVGHSQCPASASAKC